MKYVLFCDATQRKMVVNSLNDSVCFWRDSPPPPQSGPWPPYSRGFVDHTQRRTTVGRTPLDEWSARRRDLYQTTHNIHNRETSIHAVGFEPTISAGERPKTYALDRATTENENDNVTGSDYSLISSNVLTSMDNSFKNLVRKRLCQSFCRYK